MGITATTTPSTIMASQSYVPYIGVTNNFNKLNFRLNTYMGYDETSYNLTFSDYIIGTNLYTKIVFSTPSENKFKNGSSILLVNIFDDGKLNGIYTVMEVGSNYIVINLSGYNQDWNINKFTRLYNQYKYELYPTTDGVFKLDLSPVLRHKTSSILTGATSNTTFYENVDGFFKYNIMSTEEYTYTYNFIDNGYSPDGTGFIYSGNILTEIPFNVGDEVNILQNDFKWSYGSVLNDSGYIKLSGATQHSYLTGQTVNVLDVLYKGNYTVLSATTNTLTLNNTYTGTSSGYTVGTPRPSYNGNSKVVSKYYSAPYTVVVTDTPGMGSSQPISGVMKFADNRTSEYFKLSDMYYGGNKYVSDSYLNRNDYTLSKYYTAHTTNGGNIYLSVYGHNTNTVNTPLYVQKNSYGYLSCVGTGSKTVSYKFYNSNGVLLTTASKVVTTNNTMIPITIDRLKNDTSITNYTSITTHYDNIDYFEVIVNSTTNSTPYYIKVNNDCYGFDIKTIIFRDQLGSYIPVLFKLVKRDNISVERLSIYKQHNYWDDTESVVDNKMYKDRSNYLTKSTYSYLMTSGYIEEYERYLMEGLFKSPEVYLQDDNYTLKKVQISGNELELLKGENGDLRLYTINFVESSTDHNK